MYIVHLMTSILACFDLCPAPAVPTSVLVGEHVVPSGTEAAPPEGVHGAPGAPGERATDEAEAGPAISAYVRPSAATAARGSDGRRGGAYHPGVGGVMGRVVYVY